MADLLRKGDKGIDYSSYRLNPPNMAVSQGAKFVLRYSAGAASRPGHPSHNANAPKLITPAEYHGLDPYYVLLANSEWYEGRIAEGTAAGSQDGPADYELWRACGYPKGYPLFCSWDKYPLAAEYAGVEAYLRAHQAAMDQAAGERYYVTDLYAGENGIRAMQARGLAPIGWRTMALSWNDNIPASQTVAGIVQTGNYWYGQQCDENVMARDLALPMGSEDDMAGYDEAALVAKIMAGVDHRLARAVTHLENGKPNQYVAPNWSTPASAPFAAGNPWAGALAADAISNPELMAAIGDIPNNAEAKAAQLVLAKQLTDLAAAVAKGSVQLTDEQLTKLAAALAAIELPPYSLTLTGQAAPTSTPTP